MITTKTTFILGALLSASIVFAQAPDVAPAPDAAAPQAAQAQPSNFNRNRQAPIDPSQVAAHLGKRLNLTSDQVAQITPIIAARRQQMQSLRADASLSPQDRHLKVRALMQDSNSKIEALLNDTQKQQYQQMLAERRAHQHNRHAQAPQA